MLGTEETKRVFKKASLRDVAKAANVSVTTMSHYLSGRSGICSAETGRRIQGALERLHYVPNSLERGLRSGRTQCLGICMTHLKDIAVDERDSFVTRAWRGIGKVSDEYELSLLQYPVTVREGTDAAPFLDGRIDGLVMSVLSYRDARLDKIVAAGLPCVAIDCIEDLPPNCGAAWADESMTANLALNRLWSAGHRRIAFIAASSLVPPYVGISGRRIVAYIQWMSARSVYMPEYLLSAQAWEGNGVEGAITEMLALPRRPTALFCANDRIAWRVIEALSAKGFDVPGDFSVVGVDNLILSNAPAPRLTTVDVPADVIGEQAMRALMKLFSNAPIEECRICVPVTNLVEGDTVALAREPY
ncbi:MAG: LacI family DNA-binding transcriptional regulator [Capsulimonadaceae bacterium]|nr:LacI family DNA-binding transcriptional regulator [Capsulimonadaceae bacterium]